MKEYRNLFAEVGISQDEIDKRLQEHIHTFFYDEKERIFQTAGEDMGYLVDTGNNDARTEGMSYGMMMCVQLDMKEEFDRIWKWSKTNMWMDYGDNEGYFAWSCQLDGTKNAEGPAPDGEEFYAMALIFASHRWGDGEGIFNYSQEAKDILRACVHKGENGRPGHAMWNRDNHQILFVPGSPFTDPSYHLPHFYRQFADNCYEEDREFWLEAEKASRDYLVIACHPETGMCAEYAEFDGTPMHKEFPWGKFDTFFSDAYRTVANIGLDYEWCGVDVGQRQAAEKMQYFFGVTHKGEEFGTYEINGERTDRPIKHPVGLLATIAQGSLAIPEKLDGDNLSEAGQLAKEWVLRFWNEPMRQGEMRYYDNCLYMFAFMALSGNYKMI